ncbi:hypothetical protein ACU610_05705 [Geodermatophilus sp. URMC 61]|uniref:hypothetical protein n=1 Tax=Geodermatophilus sp. URMC 61 TaxID=3423411 RepID=UPI00406C503C
MGRIEVVCDVHPDTILDIAPVHLMRESVNREVRNMAENVGRVMAVVHFGGKVPDLLVKHPKPGPFVVTAHLALVYRIN